MPPKPCFVALAVCLAFAAGRSASAADGTAAPAPWRTVDDLVDGWDWSLPPGIRPTPYCGISRTRRPLPGNRYVAVRSSWRECEPQEGVYDFGPLRERLRSLPEEYVGAELHVYASVHETKYFADRSLRTVKRTTPGTAPEWLVRKYGVPIRPEKPKTNIATPFQVVNLKIFDERYHRRYLRFVEAFGRSGIPQMPQVLLCYVHGRSASRGEEAGGRYEGRDLDGMKQRLAAWAGAFKGVEHKLAWTGHRGELLVHAYRLGMGQRNGYVEMYLLHCDNLELGQRIDNDGYLVVDETCPPIRDGRAFGDENEEYNVRTHVPRFGPVETWPHRWRESMLRALQMRRNFLWANDSQDPALLAYVSLELGRNVSNTPDAWCYLRQSSIRAKGRARPVKNFERWLYQRDAEGYRTVPAAKVAIPAQQIGHHPDHKYDYTARRTDLALGNAAIGFALDDRFLVGGPHKVAIKVTYHDVGTGTWRLEYATPKGRATRSVQCSSAGRVRTVTFFLDDACFPARGMDFDFWIGAVGWDATIGFVRVIKLGEAKPATDSRN